MPKFTITKCPNGDFQFNLKINNDHIILVSQRYSSKAGCKNGIELLRDNAPIDARYERKISMNGQYYFNLTLSSGFVICTSEMYESVSGRDKGVELVKENTPHARVEDLS